MKISFSQSFILLGLLVSGILAGCGAEESDKTSTESIRLRPTFPPILSGNVTPTWFQYEVVRGQPIKMFVFIQNIGNGSVGKKCPVVAGCTLNMMDIYLSGITTINVGDRILPGETRKVEFTKPGISFTPCIEVAIGLDYLRTFGQYPNTPEIFADDLKVIKAQQVGGTPCVSPFPPGP
jgi:hypothetical protein